MNKRISLRRCMLMGLALFIAASLGLETAQAKGASAPVTDPTKLSGLGHIVYASHNWYGIDYEATIKLMDSLGVKRWRNWMHTRWLLTDPHTIHTANALQMKMYIAEAQLYGIEVIGMNHDWFNGTSDGSAVPMRNLAAGSAYRQFLQDWEQSWTTLASYFPEIDYWEIGNEWDNDVFLHPLNYNDGANVFTDSEKAAIALDMMYYASQAIHAVNPNAVTIMGGLSTVNGFEAMQDFLEDMYVKIGSGSWPSTAPDAYFQILSWHPYMNSEPDAAWVAQNDVMYNIAVLHGDGGKKVFLTEYGFSDWGNPDLDRLTGEWIEQAYALVASDMEYVETLFLFRLLDERNSAWGHENEKYFGLFTEPEYGFKAKARAFHYQQAAGGTGDLQEFENGNYIEEYRASSGFSLAQQGPRWYYERTVGGVYTELDDTYAPWSSWIYPGTSLAIGNNWQAPHESGNAVRTWVAPRDGIIHIDSDSALSLNNDGENADGVQIRIALNNSIVWPTTGWTLITFDEPFDFDELTLSVQEGDKLRFIVDPNSNSWYDTLSWNPIIAYEAEDMPGIEERQQQAKAEAKKKAQDARQVSEGSANSEQRPDRPAFLDLPERHWAFEAMAGSIDQGILFGYPGGYIRPNAYVSRAEFAVMFNRYLNASGAKAASAAAQRFADEFADEEAWPEWAADGIQRMTREGYMKGKAQNRFEPSDSLTRAELAVILARVAQLQPDTAGRSAFTDNELIPEWARAAVQACVDANLLQGRSLARFEPLGEVSRAEVATIMQRLAEQH